MVVLAIYNDFFFFIYVEKVIYNKSDISGSSNGGVGLVEDILAHVCHWKEFM
jgi:hypothetical protein